MKYNDPIDPTNSRCANAVDKKNVLLIRESERLSMFFLLGQ